MFLIRNQREHLILHLRLLKNCFFGATYMVKNNDKGKYVYSGFGIPFNGKGEWSFGNDYPKIFGVDNSSSSHTYNLKNNFLILVEGDTFGINGSFGAPEKSI